MSLCGFFALLKQTHSDLLGYLEEVKPIMTLNILFFTITIKKRNMTVEEAIHNEMVMKIYEANHDRQLNMHRPF